MCRYFVEVISPVVILGSHQRYFWSIVAWESRISVVGWDSIHIPGVANYVPG